MYIQVLQPVAPKGSKPIPTNPDALASVLAGTDATQLPSGSNPIGSMAMSDLAGALGLADYVREGKAYQLRMFQPPLRTNRGMGCAGKCGCHGKCGGMGQTDSSEASLPSTPPTSPSFWQSLTDPIASNLQVLTQQLNALNQQTSMANDAMGTSNMGTWILVGLGAFGLWQVLRSGKSAVGGFRKTVRRRKSRAMKRSRLQAELAAL